MHCIEITCNRWSCEACNNMVSKKSLPLKYLKVSTQFWPLKYLQVLTPFDSKFETPNTATIKPRKDLPTKSPNPEGLPTGLVVAVALLFLGGVSWLSCCLWAVCRGLKIGSRHTSDGEETRPGSNLFLVSKQRNRENNQQTHSEAMSEEGPDYENTRQKYSVYDAMYENWTAVSLFNHNLFFDGQNNLFHFSAFFIL